MEYAQMTLEELYGLLQEARKSTDTEYLAVPYPSEEAVTVIAEGKAAEKLRGVDSPAARTVPYPKKGITVMAVGPAVENVGSILNGVDRTRPRRRSQPRKGTI